MQSDRTLDYGSGFYTTTSEKQSQARVLRRMLDNCLSCGYVNVYDFDDNKLLELNCLLFAETNKEWAAFVLANRIQTGYSHDYDVVYGSVANDKVYLHSELYKKLSTESTKYWHFGPVDLYAELKTELGYSF
jgi:hypothetical protein